jgi:hypothetical protein
MCNAYRFSHCNSGSSNAPQCPFSTHIVCLLAYLKTVLIIQYGIVCRIPDCHWNSLWTYSFRPHCGPWIDSAFNSTEYQECILGGKGGRCVGLKTLPLHVPIVLKSESPILPDHSDPVPACAEIAFALVLCIILR